MRGARFGLVAAERAVDMPGGASTSPRKDQLTKTPVSYLDFTLDGRRLARQLNGGPSHDLDYVGVIQDAWPVETVDAIERLLGERSGDLPDGCVSLYVCPECGDLGCGAVTARLVLDGDTATWADLGVQADYEDEIHSLAADDQFPSFIFDRGTYESVLRRELSRIRPLRQGFEYPHQREQRQRRQRRTQALRRLFRLR